MICVAVVDNSGFIWLLNTSNLSFFELLNICCENVVNLTLLYTYSWLKWTKS